MARHHIGPAPSEQVLFRVWDLITNERERRGEKAAAALAIKALQAIQFVGTPSDKVIANEESR